MIELFLCALALFLGWHLSAAAEAFQDLRDLVATAPECEAAFLGLHRPTPGQGRAQPSGERLTRSDVAHPASLSGLHEASLPPLRTSDDWPEVLRREAAQAVLRG